MTTQTTKTITCEYDLPGAPKKVWRALTEPKLLAAWLMDNDIRPEVGHRFTFRSTPVPGWDGVVHCEILEVQPLERLRYSWRGGSGPYQLDTTVTWTLARNTSGGTLLRLEHAGFTDRDDAAYDGIREGWTGHLAQRIAAALANEPD